MLGLILLIAALVVFILAAIPLTVPATVTVPAPLQRLNLLALGLALLTASMLAGRWP